MWINEAGGYSQIKWDSDNHKTPWIKEVPLTSVISLITCYNQSILLLAFPLAIPQDLNYESIAISDPNVFDGMNGKGEKRNYWVRNHSNASGVPNESDTFIAAMTLSLPMLLSIERDLFHSHFQTLKHSFVSLVIHSWREGQEKLAKTSLNCRFFSLAKLDEITLPCRIQRLSTFHNLVLFKVKDKWASYWPRLNHREDAISEIMSNSRNRSFLGRRYALLF